MKKKISQYILLFCGTLLVLFGLQNLIIRIPNKYIKDNLIESLDYYEDVNDIDSIINKKDFFGESLSIHYYSDCITLNMINNSNKNNPFKAQVLMEYYTQYGDTICESFQQSVLNDVKPNNEYSRYWHGSIIFLKPLLLLMSAKSIKILFCTLFFILSCYLIYLIFKKSPILAILFSISLVCCTFYLVPMCFEYFFASFIMLISSIVVMKNLDKDNNFYYKLFIIIGVSACFFDFLAYEVLTIMVPLFLKIYFDNYKEKKINFKQTLLFIVKCALFWGISYAITFATKWILSALILGPTQFLAIWDDAKVRVYDTKFNKFYVLIQAIIRLISMIFPFSLSKKGPILFAIYTLFVIYAYIFHVPKERKKLYNLLLIVSLIGVLRLTVLFTHSWGHYFFDYRNLFPFVLWTLLIIYETIINIRSEKNETNHLNSVSKRRNNIRKSNHKSKKLSKKK